MVPASQFESRPLDTLDLNQVYKHKKLVGKIELEKASGKATGAD
jgi:hypothetical protein